MRLRRICALALGLLLGLAHALPAAAQTRTGIVLVHGKQRSPQTLQGLTDALTVAGYLVDRPEMCWSERRIYDLPYLDCLRDVDAVSEEQPSRSIAARSVGSSSDRYPISKLHALTLSTVSPSRYPPHGVWPARSAVRLASYIWPEQLSWRGRTRRKGVE